MTMTKGGRPKLHIVLNLATERHLRLRQVFLQLIFHYTTRYLWRNGRHAPTAYCLKVDGREARKVERYFLSGSRGMRCGSGNLTSEEVPSLL